MRRSGIFCFMLFFLLPALLPAGVRLSSASVREMHQIIESMKGEVKQLKAQSAILQDSARSFRTKCERLERELKQVSLSWESSEEKVVSLNQKVAELQTQLEGLREDYSALRKSWQKQKRRATFWKAATVVTSALAVEEMTVGAVRKLIRRSIER